MSQAFPNFVYLVAGVLFMYVLKGLSHPRKAVRANQLGAAGMTLAIVVTIAVAVSSPDIHGIGYVLIAAGIVIGSVIGATFAIRVPMTSMPQMVGLLNGFGGGASMMVASGDLIASGSHSTPFLAGSTMVAGLIGTVTFFGSLVAAGKLQELKWVPSGNVEKGQRGYAPWDRGQRRHCTFDVVCLQRLLCRLAPVPPRSAPSK